MKLPCWHVVAAETINAAGHDCRSGLRVKPKMAENRSEQSHGGHAEDAGDVQGTGINADNGARLFEERSGFAYIELVRPIYCIRDGGERPHPAQAVEIGADLDHNRRRAFGDQLS
jgi:hypothetical protein